MAQAAASGHELIEGIVVEGVSSEAPRGPVTQSVQFGEVHTEVSHVQELWRHRWRGLRRAGPPSTAGREGEEGVSLSVTAATCSSGYASGRPHVAVPSLHGSSPDATPERSPLRPLLPGHPSASLDT